VDKNPAYPHAATNLKRAGQLWRFSRLLQCKYLNNIVEQDHRRIKRLVRRGLVFGSVRTARRTLAGYEAMAMIRKRQVHNIGGRDMPAQGAFHRQTLRDRRLKSSILSASLVSIERLQQNPARLSMSWATMALPSMRSRRVSSRPLASTSALPAQVR